MWILDARSWRKLNLLKVDFNSTVLAEKKDIPTVPSSLKNPNALTIKIGSTTVTYDGTEVSY